MYKSLFLRPKLASCKALKPKMLNFRHYGNVQQNINDELHSRHSVIQYIMRTLTLLTFFLVSINQIKALSLCTDPSIDKLSICKNVENYDKSFPGDPIKVRNSVTVLDIVEFNADDNTITLFVQIMVMWNDTRLTLTTGDATE